MRTRQFAGKLYGFLGKPALGARKRATPLKNAAIAAVSGNGGKRGRAIDFIDSLNLFKTVQFSIPAGSIFQVRQKMGKISLFLGKGVV